MIAIGFLGFGIGTWEASKITADWDFWELFVPQILRGVSLMLCMVPITNLSLGTLEPHTIKNASGLFNVTRNLGGAVGLAVINTVLNDRTDLHLQRLRDHVAWGRAVAEDTLNNIAASLGSLGSTANDAALTQVAGMVRQQATVMAFGDVFLVMTGLFVLLVLATPLMRRPQGAAGGGGGH